MNLFRNYELRTAFAPQERRRLPTTLVTGWLGSGKTTVMRHVLANRQDLRVACVVNDFAELNIDVSPDDFAVVAEACTYVGDHAGSAGSLLSTQSIANRLVDLAALGAGQASVFGRNEASPLTGTETERARAGERGLTTETRISIRYFKVKPCRPRRGSLLAVFSEGRHPQHSAERSPRGRARSSQ